MSEYSMGRFESLSSPYLMTQTRLLATTKDTPVTATATDKSTPSNFKSRLDQGPSFAEFVSARNEEPMSLQEALELKEAAKISTIKSKKPV